MTLRNAPIRPSGSAGTGDPWQRLICLVIAAGFMCSSCGGLRRALGFKDQERERNALGTITGTVDTKGGAQGALIVVLAEPAADPEDLPVLIDTDVRIQPGTFTFRVAAGRYQVGGYEDRNGNKLVDVDEPVALVRDCIPILEVAEGEERVHNLMLDPNTTIPELEQNGGQADVFDLIRSPEDQEHFTLWAWSVQGEVVEDLDDPMFGPEAGPRGLWKIMDVLTEGNSGVYFMEPYDPERIPVLFVHGIEGYPQSLEALMAGIDQSKYQAWFYFYPSGFRLEGIGLHLADLLERLTVEHQFDQMAIVAHSMGGLVARRAILAYVDSTGTDTIRFFATLATPWGGSASAKGAADAPIELPDSFSDMSPESDFLRDLFYMEDGQSRPLPGEVRFHLLFGYHMSGSFLSFNAEADDGTISLSSMLRPEAQEDADTQRGFNQSHVGILEAPEVVEHLNELLDECFEGTQTAP